MQKITKIIYSFTQLYSSVVPHGEYYSLLWPYNEQSAALLTVLLAMSYYNDYYRFAVALSI